MRLLIRSLLTLCLIVPALGHPRRLDATTIVVIYTPEGYWVGADGARTSYDPKDLSVVTVCKVHESPLGLLLITGSTQDFRADGTQYSVGGEIQNVLKSAHNSQEFETQIEEQYRLDIFDSVADQMSKDFHRPITADFVKTQSFNNYFFTEQESVDLSRTVVLMPLGAELLDGVKLSMAPRSKRADDGRYEFYAWSSGWMPAKGQTDWDFSHLPPSVRMYGEKVSYTKANSWIVSHPSDAIHEMLDLSHNKYGKSVGPPYTILRVTTSTVPAQERRQEGPRKIGRYKLEWIEKGMCPSWDTSILP